MRGKQDFKLKAVGDREPVEILKDKGDVVRKADVGEEVCSTTADDSTEGVQIYDEQ